MTEETNEAFVIDRDELDKILHNLSDDQLQINEATGQLRSRLKSTLDNKGWNKTGLAIFRQLWGMSPTKRMDVLGTLEPMLDLYVPIWRDEQPDLFLQDEAETEGEK